MPPPARPAHRPRLLPIGWMVLVLSAVMYLAGSNIGSGWVIILTAAMVGAATVDLLTVWRVHRRTRVDVLLTGPATTTRPAGQRTTISRPDLGTTLQLADATETVRTVVRAAGATVTTAPLLPRGHHRQVDTIARTVGPLGLAHAVAVHTQPVSVWSRPGTMLASGRVQVILGAQGGGAAARAHQGEDDVRGVREFTSADPRRSVHWRATARQGRLMVRELEAWDGASLRIGITGGTWSQVALDLACEAVASLGEEAARQGHHVEVLADGAVMPWDEDAWHHLATLPPAVGVPARPLSVSTEPATVWVAPAGDGVAVQGDVLADRAEVARWLRTGR